jgi:hypothetical protein
MNQQLQPRTDPMLRYVEPVCALRRFHCLWLRLPAPSSNSPKFIRCHELADQALSAHPNRRPHAHQKQLHHIQLP